MSIELSAQAVALAEDAVSRGLVGSVSEALERALQLTAFHDTLMLEDWDVEYIAEVNQKIGEGLADLSAGRTVAMDGVIARARALVESKRGPSSRA